MSKVKICGLTRLEDILAVNKYKPDYVGFVFAESRRKVTKEQAKMLIEKLDKSIMSIGVFVDENLDNVISIAKECHLKGIQLHGSEDNFYLNTLKESLPNVIIIKAIKVIDKFSVLNANEINCDYILFDSASGGSGLTFNWELLKDYKKDYFLAGGLNPEIISSAVVKLNPFTVDISSGVESNGLKDEQKIKDFILQVRRMSDDQ
jgi:phosphoribosylanthranilate isomerase